MSNDPYGHIKADKATITIEADKGGTLKFKGGTMDFSAICQSNQYIEIENAGGSVSVKVRFKPKPVHLWQITESLLEGSIQEKVTKIAELFDVQVPMDEKE